MGSAGTAEAAATKNLWATVNVCDTAGAPNAIGIRANMPGNGTRQRMYMRFEAQWYSLSRARFVPSGSSSRWIGVGSARRRSAQEGYSFQFDRPPLGAQFVMRGRVDYQWRARRRGRWVVVRRATRTTRGGRSGVLGGDPAGRSDSLCVIRR